MASADGENDPDRFVRADPPADGDDWGDRHARIERGATERSVRTDLRREGWNARHARVRSSD